LLALVGQDVSSGAAVRFLREGKLDLLAGCSVDIETEVFDLFERVSHLSRTDRLIYEYTILRDAYGHRPRAAEVFASGVTFQPVKDRYGPGTTSWHRRAT
jgi:hypothetical protein